MQAKARTFWGSRPVDPACFLAQCLYYKKGYGPSRRLGQNAGGAGLVGCWLILYKQRIASYLKTTYIYYLLGDVIFIWLFILSSSYACHRPCHFARLPAHPPRLAVRQAADGPAHFKAGTSGHLPVSFFDLECTDKLS